MLAVLEAIDGGPDFATLEICTASFAAVIVAIRLPKPSFTESGQKLVALGAPLSGVASSTNIAAVARIKDGSGTVIINNLMVGQGSGDVSFNDCNFVSGETITITSASLNHAP
jgi:hypothetical protein